MTDPVIVLLPCLPITEPRVFGPWWLGAIEDFDGEWHSDRSTTRQGLRTARTRLVVPIRLGVVDGLWSRPIDHNAHSNARLSRHHSLASALVPGR